MILEEGDTAAERARVECEAAETEHKAALAEKLRLMTEAFEQQLQLITKKKET